MADIFICYRRADSGGSTGRLYDSLTERFGERSVFIDVDNISPGADFGSVIHSTLGRAKVVLVIIGLRWLGQRLADERDYVRMEILAALKGKKRIIPVLVEGAQMPPRERLPAELGALIGKHAVVLDHARWKSDVARLIRSLERSVGRAKPPSPPKAATAKKPAGKAPAAPAKKQIRTAAPAAKKDAIPREKSPVVKAAPKPAAKKRAKTAPTRDPAPAPARKGAAVKKRVRADAKANPKAAPTPVRKPPTKKRGGRNAK